MPLLKNFTVESAGESGRVIRVLELKTDGYSAGRQRDQFE
jgi:hypothetical protein